MKELSQKKKKQIKKQTKNVVRKLNFWLLGNGMSHGPKIMDSIEITSKIDEQMNELSLTMIFSIARNENERYIYIKNVQNTNINKRKRR